jgi:hypothetical protein
MRKSDARPMKAEGKARLCSLDWNITERTSLDSITTRRRFPTQIVEEFRYFLPRASATAEVFSWHLEHFTS